MGKRKNLMNISNKNELISKLDPDINENNIRKSDKLLLNILLKDQSTKKNILWLTDNYLKYGDLYAENCEILEHSITGKNYRVIKPRIKKSKQEQLMRSQKKAEVFTPSWLCNKQNNLIDNKWFNSNNIFNKENKYEWITNDNKILFKENNKSWKDYILSTRLEISCGEAPYIASRYDTTTGEMLPVYKRIGILDRKLRIVRENSDSISTWIKWSKKAVQNCYGYEWQGDSLLLARENILLSYIDHYKYCFNNKNPAKALIREIAEIISWNIWQMDGLKFVVPNSCHEKINIEKDLFGFEEKIKIKCLGCRTNNIKTHNGIYCKIMDWEKGKSIKAINLIRE